jgi:hypothetical protein
MTESKYSLFQTFSLQEEVLELNNLLKDGQIRTTLHDSNKTSSNILNPTIASSFSIYIHEDDFKKANIILEKQAEKIINNIDKDYYLFSFTNDELYDVLFKKDEWSQIDFQLAKQILTDRGETISQQILDQIERKRMNEIASEKQTASPMLIYIGFITAALGGFIGVMISLSLTSKKVLPNGKKTYNYCDRNVKEGKMMMNVAIFFIIVYFLLYLVGSF